MTMTSLALPEALPQKTNGTLDLVTLKAQIEEFKELAISYALDFMKNQAAYADTKEIKQVADIVSAVEASTFKNEQPQQQVNVLIQNLTERFIDDV